LDRIVALPLPSLQGQVVRHDQNPDGGAQLVFISDSVKGQRQAVTADEFGKFRVTLASGGWLVYLSNGSNAPLFHSKIDLKDNETRQVTLVTH
jgi:hypothetical protein